MSRLNLEHVSWTRGSWGILAVLAFWVLATAPSTAAVGRTKGQFDVSSTGAATYTIPIFTPPGPHGMQPNIALAYSSQNGGGPVGNGWGIAGVQAITRCNKTTAQDANAAAVALAASDGYCLNGRRLRITNGTYGAAGSTYQTEIADFSLITAVGTAGLGPASFTVKTKEGLTYEYGNTTDSQVLANGTSTARMWLVNLISDRWNNRVKFTYGTGGVATAVPIKIQWAATSHGASTFANEMTFTYGTNTPASTEQGYTGGTQYKNDSLLSSISVAVSGTVERKYLLTYDTSPTTGAKRLTTILECPDSSGTDCLSPTSVGYQNGQAGTGTAPLTTLGSAVNAVYTGFDFNGDGFEDLVYRDGSNWYVAMGSTSGLGTPINTGVTSNLVPGDLLGTGKDMYLAVNSGTWYLYQWNGSSFTGTSTGIATSSTSTNVSLADTNGDGKVDLIYVTGISGAVVTLATRPNTSTGSTLSFGAPVTSTVVHSIPVAFARVVPPTGWTGSHRRFDFNGDLREDIALELEYMECSPECLTGSHVFGAIAGDGFTYTLGPMLAFTAIGGWTASGYALDMNSDSCSDVLIRNTLLIAKCDGNTPVTISLPSDAMGAVDWNGDGRLDLITRPTGSTTLKVSLSNGAGFGSAVDTGITASASCRVLRVDVDGDGLDDLMCWEAPGGSLKIYRHNSPGVTPDVAKDFDDGFGITHSVAHNLTTWGNYTPEASATYPNRDYRGPLKIVGAVLSSDGIGGAYTRTYQYYGAAMNLQGRGFAGFAGRKVTDSRSHAPYTYDNFKRSFPYTGSSTRHEIYSQSGTLLFSRTFTLADTVLDATSYNQRYFVYSSGASSSIYEYGGGKHGALITQITESRTVDNWGNVTAATTTTTDKDSASSQYGQSWTESVSTSITPDTGSNWCLGLPTSTSVTYSTTVSGESSVTRSKSFTPDYVNCRHTAEVTEPASSIRRVDVGYEYDNFGNVKKVAVTGRYSWGDPMSERATQLNWGTTGQFPVSETNPLGQTTTRTYDTTYGALATETDPNGIVVLQNNRDSFGRVLRATRADGTSTVYTYADCTAYICQNGDPGSGATGINKMIVIASERDTSDAAFTDTWTYFDQLDRPIVQSTRMLSGAYSRVGRQYDAFGRVARETAPCNQGSCSAYWTTNNYDALNRLTDQSRPQSQSVATPVTTTFGYAGRTQTVTDGQGKVTTKVLDVMGHVRRSQDHDGYYQSFAYNAFGSLKQVTDSLSNTLFSASYDYGVKAFQTSSTDMDLGARTYKYNSLGDLTEWTDAKGQNFGLSLDKLSRVRARTEPDGSVNWNWGTSAANHNIGRLESTSSIGHSESLTYDNKGRLISRSIITDQSYVIDYAYNSQGKLDVVTWPTSTSSTRVKVKYGYQYGILASATDYTSGSLGTVYWQASTQNARGQITQESLGNGVVTTRTFDAVTGQVSSIQSGVSGGSGLQNESYLYDLVGNVTQRQNSNAGLTENFYYDNLYRLTSSKLNGTTNLSVAYDGMGNITSRSDVASGASWTYHSTKKHAVAQAGSGSYTYAYDANGNVTSRSGDTITWTSANYPASMTKGSESVSFSYNLSREYFKQVYTGPAGSETTHYIGGILEKVVAGGVSDWRHLVKVGGQTVAIISRKSSGTNAVNYLLEDHQGSPSMWTNSSGSSVVKESFTAYGLPRNGSTWSGAVPGGDKTAIAGISRRGYTGHSMLGDMGLIHMNGRVQDAITGRFLSADPYVQDPGFTQSYNRYAYVVNNPLSYIDPSGFYHPAPGCQEKGYNSYDCEHWEPDEWDFLNEFVLTGHRHTDGQTNSDPCASYDCSGRPGPSTGGGAGGGDGSSSTPQEDHLQGDLTNFVEKTLDGDWWGAVKAGLKMIGNSWKDAYSTPERGVLTTMSMIPIVGIEAKGAQFSLYDATGGLKGLRTNLSGPEFVSNLKASGYTATERVGTNGPVTVLQNGNGSTWTVYTRTSTGDAGAEFFGANGQHVKYNLEK
ncbi:MAG: RHS repeat-associated core domain-containing protein [Steroidobacteraceae bacterium]